MKDEATKQKFIEQRANDKSLRAIAKALNISKDTAAAWDKKFSSAIATRKNEHLQDLYKEYGMVKESRIRRIGDILNAIDNEIDERINKGYWYQLSLKDLLMVRREYQKDLVAEYAPIMAAEPAKTGQDAIRANFMAFMMKVQAGEINASDMKQQAAAFIAMAQAEKTTAIDPFALDMASLVGNIEQG